MKNFIDNVAIQVVKDYLVTRLRNMLSSSSILQMKSDLVSKIAAESSENQTRREKLLRKFIVLKMSLKICKRYVDRSASSKLCSNSNVLSVASASLQWRRRNWHYRWLCKALRVQIPQVTKAYFVSSETESSIAEVDSPSSESVEMKEIFSHQTVKMLTTC